MKKALLFTLILSFCLCLFACGEESDVPSGMFLASNGEAAMDYKLFAPEGWVVAQATATTTQVFVSNSDRTNVLVNQWNVTETTKTVDDWWKYEYRPQVETAIQSDDIEKANGVSATLGGVKAMKYTYTGKVGDTDFMYEVYACVTKGSIYVIHVTYMEDGDPNKDEPTFSTVESHKTSIDAIISTFKFN